MFLREGSQVRATSFALIGVTLSGLVLGAGPLAAQNGLRGGALSVELPREILPWRRGIEGQAYALLAAARQSRRAGDNFAAERQFRALVRKFARTHAAAEGKRELAMMRGLMRGNGAVGRRGLGVPPGRYVNPNGRALKLDPVAGWETTVKPDAKNIREALIEAAGDRVFFKQGSTKLNVPARAILKKQARWLKTQPKIRARIAGHADDSGSAASNMRLSHDRAVAVRRQLLRYGVPAKRLRVFSHGKSKPIAICTVRTCSAQNRRVVTEIRLMRQFSAAD